MKLEKRKKDKQLYGKIFIISVIFAIILTPCSFNFPEINNLYAQTEIHCGETISQSATWTASSSPYIISGDYHLRILPGVVLTIEPGVIVKFSENGGLAVDGGEIIAKGTEEKPIIFTSNNGSSYPQPGGWSSIEVYNHGKITFDYAVVEYGGFIQYYELLDNKTLKPNVALAQDYYYDDFTGAITVSGAQADINNSIIASSTIGLKIMDIGDPDYSGYPAYATSTVSIHNSKIYNNDRYGVFNGGASQVDAVNNWWGDDSGPRHYSNPAGTGDVISGDVLFDPWIGKPAEAEIEPVIIVPGIMGSWNVSGKWELDPILHTYDNLWEALKSAGYEENKTLFAFPYQWRLSNNYTALLLKDKIQEVKNVCQCDRVDLVTHSMGGLAARAYIQSNDYQDDVDQLIFLGTPHKGSTKAYLAWEGGEFGPRIKDKIQQRIFTLEADFNGYGSVFKYIRGLPMQSVQELLPIYDYLRDKDTMQLRIYPDNYPVNAFLELLNNQSQLEKLNNINITNILADAGSDSTINNLRVVEKEFIDEEWEHGYPEHYGLPFTDHGLEYGPGDITVPERSNKDFLGLENIIINSDHNDIVTDAQKTVIKILTGVEPAQEIRKNIFSKFLLVRIFSPADFTVIAPNGSKIGKNIDDSATIESAFYSGFDSDIEFAIIPDPIEGEYKIELEGTGEGEYKLSVSYVDDEQDVDKDFVGKIQIGQTRDFTIIYSEQEEEPIGDLATISSTIADIEEMYNKGWITKKSDKNLLIYRLKYLEKRLEHFDKQIENIEKLIQQAQDNEKLKPKAKEKILQALNKRMEEIAEQRQKTIERNLDWLERKLDAMGKGGVINQNGYDIIISDINYLRNNL